MNCKIKRWLIKLVKVWNPNHGSWQTGRRCTLGTGAEKWPVTEGTGEEATGASDRGSTAGQPGSRQSSGRGAKGDSRRRQAECRCSHANEGLRASVPASATLPAREAFADRFRETKTKTQTDSEWRRDGGF